MISYSVIESLIYEALEANRGDIYQYARKEIICNERDYLTAVTKAATQIAKMNKQAGHD